MPAIFESVTEVELGPTGGKMKVCATLCHFSNTCYGLIIGLLSLCLVAQIEIDLSRMTSTPIEFIVHSGK